MRRKARVNAHKANAPAIAGLFVEAADTTDSSGYWSALSNAAPRNQVSLQHIRATTRIVRAVIPEMLRQDAKSWLLLHRPDHDEEFLVLPYPDIAILRHLRETGGLSDHAFLTLEEIRGERDRAWFPSVGYTNLSRLKAGKTRRPAAPDLHISRFQVVSIDRPITEVLEHESWEREEQRQLLRHATTETRSLRRAALARILDAEGPMSKEEVLRELDERLHERNLELADQLCGCPEVRAVDDLSSVFGDLLDEESRRFLVSSQAVTRFAAANLSGSFDYSLPASGIWKTVERELNLSLIWFVRARRGVANATSPWTAIMPARNSADVDTGRGNSLNLNERDGWGSSRLRGVMLGPMQHLFRAGYDNGLETDLRTLLAEVDAAEHLFTYVLGPSDRRESQDGTLPWLLRRVSALRNRHAHIEAMDRSVFEELEALVLEPHQNPWSSHLGQILGIKRYVLENLSRSWERE